MTTKSDFSIIPRKEGSGRKSNRPSLKQLAKDYGSMPTKAMAEKYGVSESTVRSWVFRARRGMY